MRLVAAAETFCTIMSRLICASASAVKMRAASPTLSGTPTTVILASLRSWATPAMIAASMRALLGGVVVDAAADDGALELAERRADVDRDVVAAGVLDAPQVQDLGAAGGELEHLLVGDGVELAGRRDDARVGGEDAVDVGVDLADVGLERRGERDRGRVGAAATEGGDLLGVLGDALEAGDDHDVAVGDGRLDAARA